MDITVTRFDISLKNGKKEYVGGDIIYGNVILVISRETTVKEINISCRGEGHVEWISKREGRRDKISEDETYLDLSQELQKERDYMDHGFHSFPFLFILPPDLPASYEGVKGIANVSGYVRYRLSAVLNSTSGVKEFSQEFRIRSHSLDLNAVPEARNSSVVVEKDFGSVKCCWRFKSEPVAAMLRIVGLGYTPGQNINIYADIKDKAQRGIRKTEVKLIRRSSFFYGWESYTRSETISMIEKGPIPRGGCDNYDNEPLPVPETPPSSFPKCELILTDYFVELSVFIKGRSKALTCQIPVIIGTVPLRTPVIEDTKIPVL